MSVVLSSYRARMESTERQIIVEALQCSGGSVKPAARVIGLPASQLRRIIERLGLWTFTNANAARSGNAEWRALR